MIEYASLQTDKLGIFNTISGIDTTAHLKKGEKQNVKELTGPKRGSWVIEAKSQI